ncbi:MAG: hypothetical protein ACLGI6_11065 [Gammaproteobacteria bacterium]
MKRTLIDFADERGPWRWDLRMAGTRAFVVLALAALVVGGLAAWRGAALQREQARVEEELERVLARHRSLDAALRKQSAASSEDEQMARQAGQHRALPWEAVFQAFEQVPQGRMESFEPDLARGIVKVQASLPDVDGVQAYLGQLQATGLFTRVDLLRHELAQTGADVSIQYEAVLGAPYRLPQDARGGKP